MAWLIITLSNYHIISFLYSHRNLRVGGAVVEEPFVVELRQSMEGFSPVIFHHPRVFAAAFPFIFFLFIIVGKKYRLRMQRNMKTIAAFGQSYTRCAGVFTHCVFGAVEHEDKRGQCPAFNRVCTCLWRFGNLFFPGKP